MVTVHVGRLVTMECRTGLFEDGLVEDELTGHMIALMNCILMAVIVVLPSAGNSLDHVLLRLRLVIVVITVLVRVVVGIVIRGIDGMLLLILLIRCVIIPGLSFLLVLLVIFLLLFVMILIVQVQIHAEKVLRLLLIRVLVIFMAKLTFVLLSILRTLLILVRLFVVGLISIVLVLRSGFL